MLPHVALEALDEEPESGWPIHQIMQLRAFHNAATRIDAGDESAYQERMGQLALELRTEVMTEDLRRQKAARKGTGNA